jgi:hypothetical protein
MTEHRQWGHYPVKRRRSTLANNAESPIADDRDHHHLSTHHSEYYGPVPPVGRTSTATARRMSVTAAPVPFTESMAARSSECGCCSCIAAAARAYNASQQAHTTAHPSSVSQAQRPHVRSFAATSRTSDSRRNHEPEPYYLEARPRVWMVSRGLTSDLHSANPPSSDDGKRPTKRRRTQQLDHILDATLGASTSWETQERPRPSASRPPTFTPASVAGLSRSWATGVIQPAATVSSPSSSASSPLSSASSPTADRSSFSWQVVATPLPTLVAASTSPTVCYLPTTSTAADDTPITPGVASPSTAAAEPGEAGREQVVTNEGGDEWFGFLLRQVDSGTATTTPW